MGFFERLKEGLSKTSASIANGLDAVFGDYSQVDEEFFEELEEVLVMADVGMSAADQILDKMRDRVYSEHLKKPEDVKRALIESIAAALICYSQASCFQTPPCWYLGFSVLVYSTT